jgi:hypothetical protein
MRIRGIRQMTGNFGIGISRCALIVKELAVSNRNDGCMLNELVDFPCWS